MNHDRRRARFRYDPRGLNGKPKCLAPTMDPTEAQLFDLQRIIKKAAAGLTDAGAPWPRGFITTDRRHLW